MAITVSTLTQMVIESGNLYVAGVDLGALTGATTFAVEQEIFSPQLGGAEGNLAATGKVLKETALLTVTVAETTIGKLVSALPTLASASDANSEYATTPDVGLLGSGAYATVTLVSSTTNAQTLVVLLFNASAEGGLAMGFEDDVETSYEITFAARYAASAALRRAWQLFVLAAGIIFLCDVPLAADLTVHNGDIYVYLDLQVPAGVTVTVETGGTLICI
jgi:hypothetical protein